VQKVRISFCAETHRRTKRRLAFDVAYLQRVLDNVERNRAAAASFLGEIWRRDIAGVLFVVGDVVHLVGGDLLVVHDGGALRDSPIVDDLA